MAIAYPTIPSSVRSQPAPIPGGGSIASLAPQQGVTGMAVPGQHAPIGGMPAPAGVPQSGYGGGSFNVGNVGVGFNPQSFVNSDPYKFIMNEQMDQVMKQQAFKGLASSGGAIKAIQDRAGGVAGSFWGQQLDHDRDMARINAGISEGNANRTVGGLSSLASMGFGAAGGMGNAALGYGNAGAGGTIGAQSAMNQGIGSAGASLADFFANRRAQQPPPAQPGGWVGMN